jgi:hypothetical protein
LVLVELEQYIHHQTHQQIMDLIQSLIRLLQQVVAVVVTQL